VLEVPEADALVLAHGLDNGRERTASKKDDYCASCRPDALLVSEAAI
jgi:hypothetical protein